MRELLILSVIFSSFCSCARTYRRTEKVCDKKLYLEIYERRQLGVSYLTDSVNFKIYVGQLNFGLERYEYKCLEDSVFIFKLKVYGNLDHDSLNDERTGEYRFSIKQLVAEKKFEN